MTRGAQPARGEISVPGFTQAPLWGVGRVLALERPDFWGGIFDLSPGAPTDTETESLLGGNSEPRRRGPDRFPRRPALYPPPRARDAAAFTAEPVRDIGSEQVTIVGHSMGAVIAAIFSGIRSTRVRNLVLIECPLPSGSNHEDTPDRIATQLDFVSSPSGHALLADVRTAAQRLRHATPSLPDHFAMRVAQRIIEPCEGGVRWRWDARLQTRAGLASEALDDLDPMAYREVIRRITSSVTLVFAESSGFVKPEQVALLETELARSRRVVLPGAHNLHLDASAALARVIADAAASRSAADSI